MEIRIKTGKLTKNLSILNTYAADSNYEFSVIRERRGDVNKHIFAQPKNLINFRRTDNNGQPHQTEHNKNVIGDRTLRNKQPNINGLHLNETCELNDFVCCATFLYPRNKTRETCNAAKSQWWA